MLRPVSIFRGLHKNSLFEVARKAKEIQYDPGDVVVSQGEPGDALFVVVEGQLDVHRNDQPVAQLAPGDYFGELSLIDGEPRSATIVARDEVVLLTLTAADFNALLDEPYVLHGVMVNLARLIREAYGLADAESE